jgi:dTDP-4-amino-4,6-dideoxygalactose transaminase
MAEVYHDTLASLPCRLPPTEPGRIYYRYVIAVQQRVSNLIQELARQKVEAARPVYRPLHHYLDLEGYPGAEMAWNSHLSLPIYPSLTAEEVSRVCQALQLHLKENSQ